MNDSTPDKIVDRVLYGVDAVIFDERENVLMLRRNVKSEHFKTGWEYVKGGLKCSETHLEAALREIKEEAGNCLNVEPVGVIDRDFRVDARYRNKPHYDIVEKRAAVFLYRSGSVEIDSDEHSDYRWMPFDEARGAVWVEFGTDILDAALVLLRRSPVTRP